MNAFLDLLKTAKRENWCTKPGCTTCGSTQYRSALQKLASQDGTPLARAMAEADPGQVMLAMCNPDAVIMATRFLHRGQLDEVLSAWLPGLGPNPRLADHVLFYLIRSGTLISGISPEVARSWVDACFDVALNGRDNSLVESLLYTVPERCQERDGFMALAAELGEGNPRVKRAMNRLVPGTQETAPRNPQPERKSHLTPLHFKSGHVFLEIDSKLWLFDTGAPTSFGSRPELSLAGKTFTVPDSYMGLTAPTLSGFIGEECVGLLGADVLGQFDFLMEPAQGTAEISTDQLEHTGEKIALEEFMGIPIVQARIGGQEYRMFFDTGAQFSYWQDESLKNYPTTEEVTDFYPGFGEFQTQTHDVETEIGGLTFTLCCGTLPGMLGASLMMAGTVGIVGNSILQDRVWGFFPRRGVLVL
jgi:hypothetical protein